VARRATAIIGTDDRRVAEYLLAALQLRCVTQTSARLDGRPEALIISNASRNVQIVETFPFNINIVSRYGWR